MQERWFVGLGFLPMVAGAVALLLLRRPAATQASRGPEPLAAAPAPSRILGSQSPGRVVESYLGVVVAGHTADLGAELGGSVVRVLVHEGEAVHAGDPLVYIDPEAASSEAHVAEAELERQLSVVARAQAQYDEASDILSRVLTLGKGVADQTVVAARARAASTAAALAEARAGLDVGKARIRREQGKVRKHLISAPFAGIVVALRVDPGDVVAPGQVVARVISEDTYLRFAVPAEATAVQKIGARVQARRAGQTGGPIAIVTDVLPEVDAASGLVFVRAQLPLESAAAKASLVGTRVVVVPEPWPAAVGSTP
jgi:multidrug efflux pump subunit AcrA (membrane-fusion protein)